MDEDQIKVLVSEIERITSVEICGQKIPVYFSSDKSDALISPGSLESTKLALISVYEFPDLEEGDDWQVVLKTLPESLKVKVERKYQDVDDFPVLIDKCVHIPGFHEQSGIQVILDCKEIRGVGFRWSLVLRVFL